MLHWTLWLAIGLGFTAIFPFALPILHNNFLNGNNSIAVRLLWLAAFVMCAALEVLVYCWTLSAFATARIGNFAAPPVFPAWTAYFAAAFVAVCCAIGALDVFFGKKAAVKKVTLFPAIKGANALFYLQLLVLFVVDLAASAVLTPLCDYVVVALFGAYKAKRLLFAGCILEAAVLCCVVFAFRKKLKPCLPLFTIVLSAVLFGFYVALWIALGSPDGWESFVLYGSTYVFVAIPVCAVTAALARHGTRSMRKLPQIK